jgi:hypothetical protein
MRRLHLVSLSLLSPAIALTIAACSGDPDGPLPPDAPDAAHPAADAGHDGSMQDATIDAPHDAAADVAPDAAADAPTDAAPDAFVDSGDASDAAPDASPDAATACHTVEYGEPFVHFAPIAAMPAYTGGAIPPGTYDAIGVDSTGVIGANHNFRATWVFEPNGELKTLTQIQVTSNPPDPKRFSGTWSVNPAANELTRASTCGSHELLTSSYTVDVSDARETLLYIGSANLRFTFRKR